jgi:hypothetical protein
MVIGRVPPPLPPRRQNTVAGPVQPRVSSKNVLPVGPKPAIAQRSVSSPVTIAATNGIGPETRPNKCEPTISTPVAVTTSTSATKTTSPQNGPTLPSVLLSLVLKEPVERSHGRIATVTAVQSLFASTVPAPPPFDYSTLVDHALLASQIALHDPQSRQQKRLPLVLSLSIGAFLVAATGIIPRYLGWMMLAGATWFGPGRCFMKELWYVSVGSVVLALLVDIFPMLTLGTLLWVGVIATSRVMEGGGKPVMGKQNTIQLVHSTATALQSGKDFKPVALDIVQNVTEWWAFRQSEPQKQRRAEKKMAKEESKIQKLQRMESEKEMKKAEMGHQEAEKLRQLEEQKELKRKQLEQKEAEKARKKEIERIETERLKAEKHRILDEEARLKKAKSEEKHRLRQRENELKQLKAEEKVTKKRKELEEKEIRERQLELNKQAKKPENATEQSPSASSEIPTLIDVEPEEQVPQVVASGIDPPVIPSSTVDSLSSSSLPSSVLEGKISVSVEVTTLAHGDLP